jgi:hypothetical protein
MRRITYLLSCVALAAGACGDDDGGTIDAGTDAPIDSPDGASCGVPVTTISAYPATYDGTVLGAGNDLTVAEGACADERGYFGSSGDDHVISLTGLTPGGNYIISLDTGEDIMMYLTEGCSGGMPISGACVLLVDQTTGAESGEFTAPADGTLDLIIDTPDDVSLTDGAYTLSIRATECTTSAQCTNPAEPICDNFECVQCAGTFDCADAANPVCDTTSNTCVPGPSMCTGDDANEPDDGPADPNVLVYPTANNPTTISGAVCNVPATEGDWFRFTATGAGDLRIAATWTGSGVDLDFYVYDGDGGFLDAALSIVATSETLLFEVPAAGDYYIELVAYDPANTAAASAYTLSLALPECASSFDCESAGEPVCDGGLCVPGPTTCTGDDVGDTVGDDGPAAARPILVPVIGTPGTGTGSVCNAPAAEADWYSVTTLAAGEGLIASLSWAGTAASPDLDVFIFDVDGNLLGTSFWLLPEVVTLSHLPAGTYYLSVSRAGAVVPAAVAYTLEVTRTAVQTCGTAADCDDVYQTQLFRGACTGGACQFIPAGVAASGAACDSPDDCMSQDCSYIAFESDAAKSVCTRTCATSTDCASLGAGFTCTTGFQTNVCIPQCAADLECGANVNSSAVDTGLPWNYLTCTLPAGTCGP